MPRPAPTPDDVQAFITRSMESMAEKLTYLAGRWLDERGHEDWSEYEKVIAAQVPRGMNVTQCLKSPFGFYFTVDEFPGALYRMGFTGRGDASWKRLK